MTRWFTLESGGDDFLANAAVRVVKTVDVPVDVSELWAALAADDAVVSWGPGATSTRWLGGRPYGVGTVREVTIAGLATVREKFYRWDEEKQMTFDVAASNRPGISRMSEDYVVSSTDTGSRLVWTVALETAGPTRLAAPVLTPVLSAAVGSMARGLAKRLAQA